MFDEGHEPAGKQVNQEDGAFGDDQGGDGLGIVPIGPGEERFGGGRGGLASLGCRDGCNVVAVKLHLVADQEDAAGDGAEDGEVEEEAPEGAEAKGAVEDPSSGAGRGVLRGRVLRGRREWDGCRVGR